MTTLNPLDLGKVAGEVLGAVDSWVTSGEERGKVRQAVQEGFNRLTQAALELQGQTVEAQAAVIKAEAQGASTIQRTWRPILMLLFGFIVAWNYVIVDLVMWGFRIFSPETPPPPRLEIPGGMWALLTTGVGGYVVGRSGEKIARTMAEGQEPIMAGLFDKRRKRKKGGQS
jgi:hypothetical protein